MAIGGRFGDGVGADDARGAAGSILDDEVLAYRLVELLDQDASDPVDRSAGRKWHHHGDRAGRVILRACTSRRQRDECERQRRRNGKSHETALSICPWIASSVD